MGMLLSLLMARGPHDNNKPAMDDNSNEYNKFDNKAGLQEVSNACIGYIVANLLALVWRALTLGIKEALGWGEGSAGCCCRRPRITAGDLKSAMEYVSALCLSNTLLVAPPDTK